MLKSEMRFLPEYVLDALISSLQFMQNNAKNIIIILRLSFIIPRKKRDNSPVPVIFILYSSHMIAFSTVEALLSHGTAGFTVTWTPIYYRPGIPYPYVTLDPITKTTGQKSIQICTLQLTLRVTVMH